MNFLKWITASPSRAVKFAIACGLIAGLIAFVLISRHTITHLQGAFIYWGLALLQLAANIWQWRGNRSLRRQLDNERDHREDMYSR